MNSMHVLEQKVIFCSFDLIFFSSFFCYTSSNQSFACFAIFHIMSTFCYPKFTVVLSDLGIIQCIIKTAPFGFFLYLLENDKICTKILVNVAE